MSNKLYEFLGFPCTSCITLIMFSNLIYQKKCSWKFNKLSNLIPRRVSTINKQKQPSRSVLRKRFLKICSKFTGEHPCQSAISINMLSNFIEVVLWHGCSPVNLLHIFRTPFPKNTSGWLLLTSHLRILNQHVQNAKYFTIMADDSTDIANEEELVIFFCTK